MIRWGWLALVFAFGCPGPETGDSNTNFLDPCDRGTCPTGSICICGICTRECDDDEGCQPPAKGLCVDTSVTLGPICPSAPPRICIAQCTDDCPMGQSCVDNRCIPSVMGDADTCACPECRGAISRCESTSGCIPIADCRQEQCPDSCEACDPLIMSVGGTEGDAYATYEALRLCAESCGRELPDVRSSCM